MTQPIHSAPNMDWCPTVTVYEQPGHQDNRVVHDVWLRDLSLDQISFTKTASGLGLNIHAGPLNTDTIVIIEDFYSNPKNYEQMRFGVVGPNRSVEAVFIGKDLQQPWKTINGDILNELTAFQVQGVSFVQPCRNEELFSEPQRRSTNHNQQHASMYYPEEQRRSTNNSMQLNQALSNMAPDRGPGNINVSEYISDTVITIAAAAY